MDEDDDDARADEDADEEDSAGAPGRLGRQDVVACGPCTHRVHASWPPGVTATVCPPLSSSCATVPPCTRRAQPDVSRSCAVLLSTLRLRLALMDGRNSILLLANDWEYGSTRVTVVTPVAVYTVCPPTCDTVYVVRLAEACTTG